MVSVKAMGLNAGTTVLSGVELARRREHGIPQVLGTGLIGYLLSSLGTVLAARRYHWAVGYAFRRWDSVHYLSIARHGYRAGPLPRYGPVRRSDLAFFPGYPLAIRLVHMAAVPWTAAAWLINAGGGLAALVVVAALLRYWYPAATATRAAQAVAVFPGAAVLIFAYSEGLFLLLATSCLVAVTRGRWASAGLLAAGASAVRPSGIYLALLLAVVAAVELLQRKDWRSLMAPLLAPWGFLAYQVWLWRVTGRPDAWFAVERWGWDQRDDFQAEFWRLLSGPRPFSHYEVTLIVAGAGYLALVLLLAAATRRGMPWLLWAYTAAMVVPLAASSRLGLRPRFLLPAFPLMLLPARAFSARWAFALYCVVSAAGLTVAAYWFAGAVPA